MARRQADSHPEEVRITTRAAIATGIVFVIFAGLELGVVGQDLTQALIVGGAALCLFGVAALGTMGWGWPAAALGCFTVMLMLTSLGLLHGGFEAASIRALPLVPIVAVWSGGPRVGLAFTAATILVIELIYGLEAGGHSFISQRDPDVELWFSAQVTAVVAGLGYLFSVFFVRGRDHAERERAEAAGRLRTHERLVSLGTLASGVAHEINNPLAYVMSNISFIHAVLKQNPEVGSKEMNAMRDALADAHEGATRIAHIVSELQTLTRKDAEPEPVNVKHAVEYALRFSNTHVRDVAQVHSDIDERWFVLADERRLQQVLINLIINAAQAMEKGGAEQNTLTIRARSEDDVHVHISVQDTGTGISPDQIETIFDPFFTTKRTGTNRGLGLAISHGIITSMGGRLLAENAEPKGARFIIELPRTQEMQRRHKEEALRIPDGLRILIVDDEEQVCFALERILRPNEVVTMPDGKDALEHFQEGHRDYDIVLCDLTMHEVSGEELHRRTSEAWPDLADRFAFITGGAVTDATSQFMLETDRPVLNKPIDVTTLASTLSQIASPRP